MSECAALRAELAALRWEIAQLKQVDEEAIAERGAQKAKQRLDPAIAAVGVTAGTALGTAGRALAKILGFLGSLASLEIVVGGLIVAAQLVYYLQSQVNALGGRVDRIDSDIASLKRGLIRVERIAVRALGAAVDAKGTAVKAQQRADAAYEFANEALRRSNRAIERANTAIGEANAAKREARQAIELSNEAVNEANKAQAAAKLALSAALDAREVANQATASANAATATANNANYRALAAGAKADNATARANTATSRANTALDRADKATLRANIAYQSATNATTRANEAIARANQVSAQITPVSRTATNANNTANQAITIAKTGVTKIVYDPKVIEPTIINQTIRTVQAIVPISIEQANREIEQRFIAGRQAVQGQYDNLSKEVERLKGTVGTLNPAQIQTIVAETPAVKDLQRVVPAIQTKVNDIQRDLDIEKVVNRQGLDKLSGIEAGLVALPAAVGAIVIPRLVTPAQVRSAAAAGTCDVAQPGGCLGSPLNNLQNGQNRLLQGLDNFTQAGQGALLTSMNATLNLLNRKIGDFPLVGGISGSLSNFMSSQVVDRAMSLATFIGVMHNVSMLTTSIQSTFFEIIDNLIAIPTLITNPNGDLVDSRQQTQQFLNSWFSSIFGATEWEAIKAQWKAYSTISSTAAQGFNNLREIHNDSQELLNMARNYTAELGNALVDEGLISEDNWDYKDPKQKIKSKGINRLERMAQGLEVVDNSLQAIEQVTATLRNITQTANEIKENAEAINKAVSDANKAAETDRNAKIEGLELPNFSLDDLF